MNRQETFDRFDLDDNLAFCDDIYPISAFFLGMRIIAE